MGKESGETGVCGTSLNSWNSRGCCASGAVGGAFYYQVYIALENGELVG